jgi:hypothetical protein
MLLDAFVINVPEKSTLASFAANGYDTIDITSPWETDNDQGRTADCFIDDGRLFVISCLHIIFIQ